MADGRRHSANSRTSTPKPATQGPGDLDELLSKAVGTRVKITTAAPSSVTLEGTIYAACRITSLVAINTAPIPTATGAGVANQPGDFHLIPFTRIQSFNIVTLPASPAVPARAEGPLSGFENLQPSLGRIDLKSLKAREEAAVRKIKERDATRGKGVTKDAQWLYDSLNRTLPVRWHEKSIIVSDAVMIKEPYKPEDCTAPKEQHNALVRVRKVVENEWKKRTDAASKAAIATPLEGPRKGG